MEEEQIAVPKSAEAMMAVLDTFLSDTNIPELERSRVWDIVSAMRGPDNDNDSLKYATTCPIRSMAFPKIWDTHNRLVGDLGMFGSIFHAPGTLDPRWYKLASEIGGYHFGSHIRRAIDALQQIGLFVRPDPTDESVVGYEPL